MGLNFCCDKRSKESTLYSLSPSNEKEIPLQKYTSPNDAYFEEIETKYNVLTYIQLIDYINLLENFSLETATVPFNEIPKVDFSGKNEFLLQKISVDEFQSFIENKLYAIKEIKELGEKNELMMTIFKSVFREIYSSLELKLNQNFNNPSNESIITKGMLIPIGIIFCSCNVLGKIKLIFDLFKNNKGYLEQNNFFDEFLLCNFLIASYTILIARKNLSRNNPFISEIPDEEMDKYLEIYDLGNCENLVKEFNFNFFNGMKLTFYEYKRNFNDSNGFGWLFSPEGIRQKLEENKFI
jgi:hypothetical protein